MKCFKRKQKLLKYGKLEPKIMTKFKNMQAIFFSKLKAIL